MRTELITARARRLTAAGLVVTAGAVAMPGLAAQAADETKFAYNIGVTSDYIFRGFSQSRRDPAVQGGVDMTQGIFYVGAWASSVNFNTATDPFFGQPFKANLELDIYGGVKPVLKSAFGDFNFDFGLIAYTYPSSRSPNASLTYVEGKAGVSKEIWKDGTLGTTLFYSPEYQLSTGRVWTSETTFSQTLPAIGKFVPSLSALYGYQAGNDTSYRIAFANGDKAYSYWNAGLTMTYDEKWSLDLRYWDTNIKNDNLNGIGTTNFCTGTVFQCSPRAMATLKYTF